MIWNVGGLFLVTISLRLERTIDRDADVFSLFRSELCETNLELIEVEHGDLLVELLGDCDDLDGELLTPEHELSKALVGEGSAHDKGRMASGASEVDKTSLSKEDDGVAVRESEAIDLRLDGVTLDSRPLVEVCTVDLVVKVTDVADNAVVTHVAHVLSSDDVAVASAGDKDLCDIKGVLDASDFVSGHGSLEGTDGVDLGDNDTAALSAEGFSTALADITITKDNSDLSAEHDISGTLDAIDEAVTASVDVVKLGLGDSVVDVDSREQELALCLELVETVDTSGGLLRGSTELLEDGVPVGCSLLLLDTLQDLVEAVDFLAASVVLEDLGVVLGLDTAVDHECGITSIVHNELGSLHLAPVKSSPSAVPVLGKSLALPCKDGSAAGNKSSSSVVLGAEDVAGSPADLCTESLEGLDKNGGLDGHVETASDTHTLQRLLLPVLLTDSHKAGHLVLGKVQLLAAPVSKAQILDLVIVFHVGKVRWVWD